MFCGKIGDCYCIGVVCWFLFLVGNVMLGGIDSGDCCCWFGFCCGRWIVFWCDMLLWFFVYYWYIYWLYCWIGDYYCDDLCIIIDDFGVLYLGWFLYLDIFVGMNRKFVCVGVGWLYCVDYCDYYLVGIIVYVVVCCWML